VQCRDLGLVRQVRRTSKCRQGEACCAVIAQADVDKQAYAAVCSHSCAAYSVVQACAHVCNGVQQHLSHLCIPWSLQSASRSLSGRSSGSRTGARVDSCNATCLCSGQASEQLSRSGVSPANQFRLSCGVCSWRRAGQPGPLTRLLACAPAALEAGYRATDVVATWIAPNLRGNNMLGDDYGHYNRPGALAHWLQARLPAPSCPSLPPCLPICIYLM